MFYLVKTENNNISIINNVETEEEKKKAIEKHFASNWINEIKEDFVITKSGKYAKFVDNHYSITQYITQDDGWIFYGTNYEVEIHKLHWVFYEQKIPFEELLKNKCKVEEVEMLEILPLIREKTSDYHISPRSDKSYAEAVVGPTLEQEKSTY